MLHSLIKSFDISSCHRISSIRSNCMWVGLLSRCEAIEMWYWRRSIPPSRRFSCELELITCFAGGQMLPNLIYIHTFTYVATTSHFSRGSDSDYYRNVTGIIRISKYSFADFVLLDFSCSNGFYSTNKKVQDKGGSDKYCSNILHVMNEDSLK